MMSTLFLLNLIKIYCFLGVISKFKLLKYQVTVIELLDLILLNKSYGYHYESSRQEVPFQDNFSTIPKITAPNSHH